MRKTKVKEILTQYRKNMDYIELYEETSSVGASFVSICSNDGIPTGSKTENDVVRRSEKEKEYEKRKQYNELVEKVLDKLPEDERQVIDYQYNLVDDPYLNQYDILRIPICEMVAYLPFEKDTFYKKRENAYNLLADLMEAVF